MRNVSMIYHETEHGILYHGDCLDILPTLADKSVDAVVTDPPYGTNDGKGKAVEAVEMKQDMSGYRHVELVAGE